ncbi:MAG: iron-sulfur cluster assembly accessory protein [Proteobacteria bacterium]|nr:iron-sulfur cluster assembly accessory protein [Pseudomonadota bacterium]
MITITPQAAEQIRASAQQSGIETACLRIVARLNDAGMLEYGMGFDEKAADDTQVRAGEVTVLIAPGCVELLSGATLDWVELNPGEPRFIFSNPNDPSHKPAGPPR